MLMIDRKFLVLIALILASRTVADTTNSTSTKEDIYSKLEAIENLKATSPQIERQPNSVPLPNKKSIDIDNKNSDRKLETEEELK